MDREPERGIKLAMSTQQTSLKGRFHQIHPEGFFVSLDDTQALELYLRERRIISPKQSLERIESAGQGNMNLTLRIHVRSPKQSLILKQARPWVEKYPSIAAPQDRLSTEAAFYRSLESVPELRAMSPRLSLFDESSALIIMEDLGPALQIDSFYEYPGQAFKNISPSALARYLKTLHGLVLARETTRLTNRAMRALNHEYIFVQPFSHGAIDHLKQVRPDLVPLFEKHVQANPALRLAAAELGEFYLEDGAHLVHGDFFPGAWISRNDTLYVIDSEFAFHGTPAWDLGCLLAHFVLARQPSEHYAEFLRNYDGASPSPAPEVVRFAGVEILRRLVGVAQLPLPRDPEATGYWLSQAGLALERRVLDWRELFLVP